MQVISLLTVLVLDYKKWPILVIVPSTTIGNWKNEFKRWAPSIKAVAMGGSKYSRDLIRDSEILGGEREMGLSVTS